MPALGAERAARRNRHSTFFREVTPSEGGNPATLGAAVIAPLISRKPLWWALMAGPLAFVLLVASTSRFVFGGFLIHDDTIYLPRAAAGLRLTGSWTWTVDSVSLATEVTDSIIGGKLLGLVMISLTATVLSLFLTQATERPTISMLSAVAIVMFPVATEPGVFVLGSHPFFAAPFAFGGLHVLLQRLRTGQPVGVIAVVVASLSFTIAAVMSPTAVFLIALPPALLIVRIAAVRSITRRDGVVLAVSILWTVLVARVKLAHHYTGLQGWVQYSPRLALSNLRKALTYTANAFSKGGWVSVTLIVLGAALLLMLIAAPVTARLRRGHTVVEPDRPRTRGQVKTPPTETRLRVDYDVLGLIAATGAALAPGLAVTGFSRRYVALAFLFGSALVALITIRSLRFRLSRRTQGAAAMAWFMIAAGAVVGGHHVRAETYDGYLDASNVIDDAVSHDSSQWLPEAQVVFAMSTGEPIVTNGYNHWSTWLLRDLSDRSDVTGLVGAESWLAKEPFVREYRDHGDEYWTVQNGRSRRIPMKGITIDAPLYVYRQERAGDIPVSTPACFVTPTSTIVVFPGDSVADAEPIEGSDCPASSVSWIVDGAVVSR